MTTSYIRPDGIVMDLIDGDVPNRYVATRRQRRPRAARVARATDANNHVLAWRSYIDGLIQWASGWGLIIANQLRAARASLANGWLAARARLWAIHNKPRLLIRS